MTLKKQLGVIGLLIILILAVGCRDTNENQDAISLEQNNDTREEDLAVSEGQRAETGKLPEDSLAYCLSTLDMEKGQVYSFMAFVTDYDLDEGTIEVNLVEWITSEEEAEAVGLDYENDMPGGFYVYDEQVVLEKLHLSKEVCYYMLNESTPMVVEASAIWEFLDYMKAEGFNYPFEVRMLNDEVTRLEQVYLP